MTCSAPRSSACSTPRACSRAGSTSNRPKPVVDAPTGGGDVLDHLVTLVDQSLVQRDAPDAWGEGIRFRLLETIRAFALEQLTNGRSRGRRAGATRWRTWRWPKRPQRTCPAQTSRAGSTD